MEEECSRVKKAEMREGLYKSIENGNISYDSGNMADQKCLLDTPCLVNSQILSIIICFGLDMLSSEPQLCNISHRV